MNDRASSLPGFTGIALDAMCGPISLYTSGLPASAVSTVESGLPVGSVIVRTVQNSLATLESVHNQLRASFRTLMDSGVDIVSYSPNMTTGYEDITVRGVTDAQRTLLSQEFGPNLHVQSTTLPNAVPVSLSRPAAAAVASPTERDRDTPGYSAGDFTEILNGTYTEDCSSNFGAHYGSGPTIQFFLIEAGHCSQTGQGAAAHATSGETSRNAYDNASGITGSNVVLGTYAPNYWNLGEDVTAIKMPTGVQSGNTRWLGGTPGATKYTNPSATPYQTFAGEQICQSGAYDGTTCGAFVSSTFYNGCITLGISDGAPPMSECDEIEATSSSVMVGPGDSGGPVLEGLSGSDGPAGITSAEAGADSLRCPYNTFRGNVCSYTIFYVDLSEALSTLGYQLN